LTDAEIAANLRTYRDQVAPFFDFSKAQFRRNSEWLADIRLPRLIEIMAKIPVSMSLQREDFRERLANGQGLAMSEFIYSVVMAIDSAEIDADIEVGGSDQLLNMQMGRKVMEAVGLPPQHIVAMPLVAGTDGSGLKMSKSARNYVGLLDSTTDIYGKIMSIPDDLTFPYARAWTEWDDAEVRALEDRLRQRTAHPMDVKKMLAGEMVAAIRTPADATAARAEFAARFSRRRYHDLADLVALDLAQSGDERVADVLIRILAFVPSMSAARRLVRQNGLRIVVETDADQWSTLLDEASLTARLAEVVARVDVPASSGQVTFLKAGRKIARIRAGS
jgi:tyrosyl-tRNA synthetase